MNSFGKNLRRLRQSKNLKQKQLCDILGFKSPSLIGMWERGEREPGIDSLLNLSNYFEVSIDELIGNDKFYYDTTFKPAIVAEQPQPYSTDKMESQIISTLRKSFSKLNKKQKNNLNELINWYLDKEL